MHDDPRRIVRAYALDGKVRVTCRAHPLLERVEVGARHHLGIAKSDQSVADVGPDRLDVIVPLLAIGREVGVDDQRLRAFQRLLRRLEPFLDDTREPSAQALEPLPLSPTHLAIGQPPSRQGEDSERQRHLPRKPAEAGRARGRIGRT